MDNLDLEDVIRTPRPFNIICIRGSITSTVTLDDATRCKMIYTDDFNRDLDLDPFLDRWMVTNDGSLNCELVSVILIKTLMAFRRFGDLNSVVFGRLGSFTSDIAARGFFSLDLLVAL